MIKFRNMESADIPRICELEKMCFAVPWSAQSFREELQNSCAVYTVIESDGKIVGYGGMWIVIDEAYITNIAVDIAYRRLGFGRQLLERMIATAQEQEVHILTLEVRTSNVPAIALYESLDFNKCGLRKAYYIDNKEDAIIMRLDLPKNRR